MSARARIMGWMALVVALAFGVAVFATWQILLSRLDHRVNAELTNEASKLRSYVTASTERDIDLLLSGYLTVNVPDGYETFFTVLDGRLHRRTFARPPADLHTDKALVTAAATAAKPIHGWAASAAGRVHYAVIPVRSDTQSGALVVAVFYDRLRGEVVDAVSALSITALVALALACLAGWLVAGQVLAPIRLVRQTAARIGDSSDLSRRLEVRGHDDVAALSATFNHMLDRLERAFAVQRDFVDDAGHELRTPITVVRGHLELMGDDPADNAETIALVLDELDRMNRIVDDLLTLAKSQQPGFLTIEEVEIADLTVSVLAKVRALGPRTWRVEEVADTKMPADRHRLTQALIQLVANAVRHTVPGDPIAVGSAVRDGAVELWVRDCGPGVPAEDRERIFGRFVRAGSRTGEGAGLGLAIVSSIAHAHGGDVRVEENHGGGALFVVRIPHDGPLVNLEEEDG
ncbi:sensor histidine kinase [Rhizohabitans arisaemae]|uniref:sensor histidine kinase n=1 Tax=Rhizohabitans arisaemae TaxID=2720610 RepID=UPI0024B234CA|nr:HAMP domain-containing sensor histidine kinase [Rhizohabitans arisaemae]